MWKFSQLSTAVIYLTTFVSFAVGTSTAAGSVATRTSVFTAVAPKLIRPNTDYNVTVGVEATAKAPMTFVLALKTYKEYDEMIILRVTAEEGAEEKVEEVKDKVIVSSEKVKVQPGESLTVGLRIGDLPDSRYNLTITGEGENGEFKVEDSNLVYKDTKQQSLLIQTDKPIYKPGEVVNFRVVMLNRFLRPMTDQVLDISILDPQQNVIKNWKQEKLSGGILATKLELSPEPNLGDWQIKAEANGQESMQTFSVDQYVLPKFKVDVILPPFITFNNTKFTAEVKAAYTYGKPMKGSCEIKISEYQQYRWGDPPKVVSKKSEIDGSAFFEFDIQAELETEGLTYEKEYELSATVTDALTGREQNGTARIRAHQYAYKIEMIEEERNYKPGFPLTLTFKVVTQDGKPIGDESPQALKVAHGYSFLAEDGVKYFPIPPTGIVKITVDTPTNELMSASSVEVTYKELTQTFYPPQRLHSPSKTYMDVSLNTRNPPVNSRVTAAVKLNKPFSSLTYVLYGRGQVLDVQRLTLPAPVKTHSFDVVVPSGAAPEATLLVYTVIQPTLEVGVDSTKFTVNSVFDNFLNLSLSKDVVEPGETVNISMDTTAGSVIAIRGVDQSVLLLKEDRDITVKTIEDEVKAFQNQLNNYRMWGGSSAFQIFEEAGLIVLTNANLEKERHIRRPYYHHRGGAPGMVLRKKVMVQEEMNMDAVAFAAPMSLESNRAGTGGGAPMEVRVRKDFTETWLWQEIQTTQSQYILEKVVPDTLTSWIITGYSLSPETGIGLTLNPTTLKTFRPFFITLNKPYSIVKGEIFGLQVLVHNYMENEVTATVTLQNAYAAFEFYEEGNKTVTLPVLSKNVVVGGVQVKSLTFVIKPIKFGNMKLEVKATCPVAGDALSQILIVKPPGQKQTRNKAVLMDLRKQNSMKQTLTTEFPPKRVEGADMVKISVISDLLGSTINNLDKLLQMPCGCGEQNMLNFVPDIVILEYLKASGTLTDEIKAKAIRFLESGYQRELTYRHTDGSFSAFGESDLQGSTWLTAFVARSFIAAKPHITIDPKVIQAALKFLAEKQQADGSFVEHGTVIHAEMKGGSADSYSLSAYVLLAFIESKGTNTSAAEGEIQPEVNFDQVIAKGLNYISSTPLTLANPYPLTLVTYTLQAAKHEKKGVFHEALEKLAKKDGDLVYWEPPKKEKPKDDNKTAILTFHWEPQTKPVSVEMTAYSVLMYLNENNLEKALSSGKWLLGQRNAEGGFISTQDTVVGLTALGKFSLATRSNDNDLKVKAISEPEISTTEFAVKKSNAMVLQEVFLATTTTQVTFEAQGKGTALAQLTWSYYVEDKSESPVFAIDVTVAPTEQKGSLKLKICTSYESSDGKKSESNMAVMEVNLPSGYAFDQEDLSPLRQVDRVKRFELDQGDTRLNIYFNSLDATERCLEVPAARVFKVANPAPAYVSVYDYYDTTRKVRAFYTPPGFSACEICVDEESCGKQNCV